MPVLLLGKELAFPPPELAEEDGLLAFGGDLSPQRLLLAYRKGIFPWFSEGTPISWWSPDPRLVLFPDQMRISRSLRKVIRQRRFEVSADQAFPDVIRRCARNPLPGRQSTWITSGMIKAYCRLHEMGYAHSLECWKEGELAGGLYGVSLGRLFFGESKFSLQPNASKVALARLSELMIEWGFDLIDCQLPSPHLLRLGARQIPRRRFLQLLKRGLRFEDRVGKWEV